MLVEGGSLAATGMVMLLLLEAGVVAGELGVWGATSFGASLPSLAADPVPLPSPQLHANASRATHAAIGCSESAIEFTELLIQGSCLDIALLL